MSQDDPRAFRGHLTGHDLFRIQERLVAAILRAPSLSSVIRVAGLSRHHFPTELTSVFDFAVRSDRNEIRRAVQNSGDDVGRRFRLGVELGHAQALQLARQIKESVERERPASNDSY
jgi:AraC-like DNA-binding protein